MGVSEQCPGFTSILGTAENGATYVIDEDVPGSGGGQLFSSNNRINNPLSDDSEAAQMAETTQREIDFVGLYSTGSLSVLVLLVLVATLFGFVVNLKIN